LDRLRITEPHLVVWYVVAYVPRATYEQMARLRLEVLWINRHLTQSSPEG